MSKEPLVINAPKQGIAQSPHIGFGDIRNLDISSIQGTVRLNTIMVKKSGTTVDAQVYWIVRDPTTTANVYALDSNGVVYNSADSGATWAELSDRGGSGQGMAIWKDYLFVAEDTTIDIYGPLSGAPSWTNNWAGLTLASDTSWHPMITSKNDNKLYIGAGRYVASVEENSGQTFAPGTPATYTATAQALDLPPSYKVKCLEELGNNLMIGTWQGTNIYDIRIADIFPWDRSSTSFGQPIVLDDFGVHAMKNMGNFLIVLAGISGTIRRCDGVNAYIIGQIPTDLSGGKYLEFYPGAIAHYKNKTFFGTGNGGTTAIGGQGVYSLTQTGRGNILNLEHLPSTLTDGSAASVKISALLPITIDTLQIGWRSDSTYGLDLSSATSYAYGTDYSGYFESPLYVVGSDLNLRKFTNIEFQLAKELATSEGIRIKYRVNLTDDWTTAYTFTYSNWPASTGESIEIQTIPSCKMIQVRVELLGTSTTTPELKYVILS